VTAVGTDWATTTKMKLMDQDGYGNLLDSAFQADGSVAPTANWAMAGFNITGIGTASGTTATFTNFTTPNTDNTATEQAAGDWSRGDGTGDHYTVSTTGDTANGVASVIEDIGGTDIITKSKTQVTFGVPIGGPDPAAPTDYVTQQYFDAQKNAANPDATPALSAGVIDIDLSENTDHYKIVTTGNITGFTFSNGTINDNFLIRVEYGGAHTMALGANILTGSHTVTPSDAAGKEDILVIDMRTPTVGQLIGWNPGAEV
jgi:hypothetical protein